MQNAAFRSAFITRILKRAVKKCVNFYHSLMRLAMYCWKLCNFRTTGSPKYQVFESLIPEFWHNKEMFFSWSYNKAHHVFNIVIEEIQITLLIQNCKIIKFESHTAFCSLLRNTGEILQPAKEYGCRIQTSFGHTVFWS